MKKQDKIRQRNIIMGDKKLFINGDKISWTYKHNLNSKSSIMITKEGVFLRYINSVYKDGGFNCDRIIYAFVQFEGNKNPSKIKIKEIKLLKQ